MSNENEIQHGEQGQDKMVEIIVNGRRVTVQKKELAFDEVVALDPNILKGPNVTYTITYYRGEGDKPEATLVQGKTVKVKEGMIFNVRATDKS